MDYYEPNYSDEESAARKWVLVIFIVAVVAIMGLQFQHFFLPPKIEHVGGIKIASTTVRPCASAAEMGMWVDPAPYASYAYIVMKPPAFVASITDLEARLDKLTNTYQDRMVSPIDPGICPLPQQYINPLPSYTGQLNFCGGEKGGK